MKALYRLHERPRRNLSVVWAAPESCDAARSRARASVSGEDIPADADGGDDGPAGSGCGASAETAGRCPHRDLEGLCTAQYPAPCSMGRPRGRPPRTRTARDRAALVRCVAIASGAPAVPSSGSPGRPGNRADLGARRRRWTGCFSDAGRRRCGGRRPVRSAGRTRGQAGSTSEPRHSGPGTPSR